MKVDTKLPTLKPTKLDDAAPVAKVEVPKTEIAQSEKKATGVGAIDAGTPTATSSALSEQSDLKKSALHTKLAPVQEVASTAKVKDLSPVELGQIATKHATCPFMGSAIATGALAVRNSAENPLASKEDIRALGNSGGGNLGDLLVGFAEGNHTKMLGKDGKLDNDNVPPGVFSLIFGGSQGSHDGNSRILKPSGRGEPGVGKTDAARFQEFVHFAQGGKMTRSQIADQIAQNLFDDPNSKVAGLGTAKALGHDLAALAKESGQSIINKLTGKQTPTDHRELLQAVTKAAGEDNLVGSAGEFGLMLAFLANSPKTTVVDGQPAYDVGEMRQMFVDKKLPDGWDKWPKNISDWVVDTTALTAGAALSYAKLKFGGGLFQDFKGPMVPKASDWPPAPPSANVNKSAID